MVNFYGRPITIRLNSLAFFEKCVMGIFCTKQTKKTKNLVLLLPGPVAADMLGQRDAYGSATIGACQREL